MTRRSGAVQKDSDLPGQHHIECHFQLEVDGYEKYGNLRNRIWQECCLLRLSSTSFEFDLYFKESRANGVFGEIVMLKVNEVDDLAVEVMRTLGETSLTSKTSRQALLKVQT